VKGKCSGGLATHILLRRGTPIFELPEELTDEVAVLANCAGATAAATIRVAGPQTGDVVAVLGAGVLGVTTIAMLADLGCHVLVFDPIEENAQRSLRFGAFRAFSRIDQLREEVQRLTNGRGADLCFELSGVKMSAEFSLNLVRIGGKIVWAGSTTPLGGIDLSPEILVRKLLTITGIHNYTEPDLAYAVAFLARTRNEWPFQSLIAKTLSLNDIEKAFVLAEKFPGARILVRP
jgi:alcohol dehydrogenase